MVMPDSFNASSIIASVTLLAPLSCTRAHNTPGTSVLPRPAPANVAMNLRRDASSEVIGRLVCDKIGVLAGAIDPGGPANDGRPDPPQFPVALAWRADFQHRHLDAEGGAGVAD